MDSCSTFRFPAQVDSVAGPKGRKTERETLRLIQIRFDDAGSCLRRLLDLSRTGLCNHGRALIYVNRASRC